jgi:plasmid maintenance system antidote protein VapI
MNEQEAAESASRIRIALHLALAEQSINELTAHATEMTGEEALRLIDALSRFGDARRALLSPLARAMPAPEGRQ